MLTTLHQSLYQHCPEIHQKRLNTLMVACKALINADCLTLTHLGRHIDGTSTHTKHSIKRMDRLLGNPHLHHERLAVYQWHAKWLLTTHTMPTILVDWSDMREGRELIALRASIAIKGRSITLYERTFPLILQGTQTAHNQFLNELKQVLPDNITPLIVTDAGFRNPGSCQRIKCLSAASFWSPIFTKSALSPSQSSRKTCWAGGVIGKETLVMRDGVVQSPK